MTSSKIGNHQETHSPTECTIVMYHYVRNLPETEYPNIKGLLIKEFIGQLDYILKNYTVISLEDYADFLNNNKKIPKKSCILTFDDGFKDHYFNVFPILKEKKVPACFFPITQPLTEFVVPPVHQTHFLLAKLGSQIFSNEFNQLLKSKFPRLVDEFLIDDQVKKENKYRWDDPLTANLKYSISALPSGPKVEILNLIFNKYFKDIKKFCQELYMSFEQMKEMLEHGMSFGSHTHTHPKLSKLSPEDQIKEIRDSKEILEKELGTKIKLFSYPYGGFNNTTAEILAQQGYLCAITTDLGINHGEKMNAFTLKRLDTNDLPFN